MQNAHKDIDSKQLELVEAAVRENFQKLVLIALAHDALGLISSSELLFMFHLHDWPFR